MRVFSGLVLVVCAAAALAQAGDEPEVAAAKAELARVQSLVAVGALPKLRLAKAQDAVADAEDAAVLRRTAYGQDLTADQADEMIAAAGRRLERRQKSLDDARKLVEAGAASSVSLQPLQEQVESARNECEVAESRASLVRELSEMAGAEEALLNGSGAVPAGQGSDDGSLAYATYAKVAVAYAEHFGKSLPVSALGETAVHRAMGFDHRGRVDVALRPDQPEGIWLLHYLTENHIPFFAFRQAVPGKATGAHIHIGPMSTKLASGG